ncbi:hypothetical protein F5876DRAFT_77699 [Lentinula aff. lateritia]|uniref:Uncharacterized protein n=1 Tax=Lentinula aff. lateritia TaxID=2804960 RepID=A0ACC1TYF7_9AGAR|nr:hypothetical protein F5876DRAFT_77699 [Lentinula aff. lateritia]
MNWPENVRITPDDDLFEDAGHIVSYGPMFDPSTNSLAAATMREKGGPQRVRSCDGPPRDHHGLAVVLRRRIAPAEIIEQPPVSDSEVIRTPILPSTGNLSIAELLELASFLPQNKNVGWAAYIPLPPASIVGNVSSSAFWELAWSRIRHNERRSGGADVAVQRMDLEFEGVKVDMHALSRTTSVWKNNGSMHPDSPSFLLPTSILVTLNAYRDVQSCTAVPSINARFWPIRFTDPGIVDVDNNASPAKSFTALTRFDTKLQNDGKFDDSQSTFISLALVKRANLDKDVGLANIIPDPFIWSDDGYDSADDDDGIEDSISREDQRFQSKRDYAHTSTNEIANQRQRAESAAIGSGYRKAWGR